MALRLNLQATLEQSLFYLLGPADQTISRTLGTKCLLAVSSKHRNVMQRNGRVTRWKDHPKRCPIKIEFLH